MPTVLPTRKPAALELTSSLVEGLRRLSHSDYRRGRHSWMNPSSPEVSFHTVDQLKMRNLVSIRHGFGRDKIVVTSLGHEIARAGVRPEQEVRP